MCVRVCVCVCVCACARERMGRRDSEREENNQLSEDTERLQRLRDTKREREKGRG